jgi:hypothetical protein
MSMKNLGVFALGIFSICLAFAFLGSCKKAVEISGPPSQTWCDFPMSRGNTAEGLGMSDFNAGYNGFIAPVKPGEKVIVRGRFPHARYVSFTIYDQDFMFADKLSDFELVPVSGNNPFLPGVERNNDAGEFEIQVLMEKPPVGKRPANTLYAGTTNKGKPNKLFFLGYRVYLADKGYGFKDNNPLAAYGGVNPPKFQIIDQNGNAYCPDKSTMKKNAGRSALSILLANLGKLLNPSSVTGKPESPPVWLNNASADTQRANTYVGNDDTAYLALPVSNKFGELLVLRWKAAITPEQTFDGKPFPANYDMRYWSLSFNYIDHSRPLVIYAEKSIADINAPQLPDGTRQLVIGFGGIARPASVPQDQWVSVKFKEGMIIMRNILIQPGYAGDFFKLPAGKIPATYDKFTPGGVYCSAQEFAQNPDIGLTREKLLKK